MDREDIDGTYNRKFEKRTGKGSEMARGIRRSFEFHLKLPSGAEVYIIAKSIDGARKIGARLNRCSMKSLQYLGQRPV